jgi:DNA-binding MarR family transcriptional regulator
LATLKEMAKEFRERRREIEKRLKPYGITFLQATVLVAASGETRTMKQICVIADLPHKSQLTGVIDVLERKMHVRRGIDPVDRRISLVRCIAPPDMIEELQKILETGGGSNAH